MCFSGRLCHWEKAASYHLEQAHCCLGWVHPAGRLLKLLQAGSCFDTTDQWQTLPALLCRQLAEPLSASSCTVPSCLHPTSIAALWHKAQISSCNASVHQIPVLKLHWPCRTL